MHGPWDGDTKLGRVGGPEDDRKPDHCQKYYKDDKDPPGSDHKSEVAQKSHGNKQDLSGF